MLFREGKFPRGDISCAEGEGNQAVWGRFAQDAAASFQRTLKRLLYNLSMSMTALDLSPEALKKYRPLDAIRKRRAKFSMEIASRRRRAHLARYNFGDLLAVLLE